MSLFGSKGEKYDIGSRKINTFETLEISIDNIDYVKY